MKLNRAIRDRLFVTLLPTAGRIILRLLYGSLRLSEEGASNIHLARGLSKNGKVIFATWHSHLVIIACHLRGRGMRLLISRHRDGQLISSILEKFGYSTVRGSSSRGGAGGLLGMVRGASKSDLGLTPDGPRGPAGQMKPGVAILARITGMPVIPIGYSASRHWRLASWDRHVVPKPGSSCCIRYGSPVRFEGDTRSFIDTLTSELNRVSTPELHPEKPLNQVAAVSSVNSKITNSHEGNHDRVPGGGRRMLFTSIPSSTILQPLLFPLSILYRAAVTVRYFCFRAGFPRGRRLPAPVISVGSLKAGGTGKTPLVAELAAYFIGKGFRPAILTRGYGGRSSGTNPVVVSDGEHLLLSPEDAGDEPWMLATNNKLVPVVLGKDRYVSGLLAIKSFGADLILLDDGFQHFGLQRSLDIIVHKDPLEITSGNLLPAGFLREPTPAVGRADIVVFTGMKAPGGDGHFLTKPVYYGTRKLVGMISCPGEKPKDLFVPEQTRIAVLTGIAGADRFLNDLLECGYSHVRHYEYPDHFPFSSRDIDRVSRSAKAMGAEYIFTTEKDLVRIKDFKSEVPILAVIMQLDMPDAFYQAVMDTIGEKESADQQE